MLNLQANKVSMGENHKEYANFLQDLGAQNEHGSMDSSHMMINVSDLDEMNPLNRANTVTGKLENHKPPGNDYSLNFSIPTTAGQKARYGNASSTIVANARQELDKSYQSSALPRTRLSMEMVSGGGTMAASKRGSAAGEAYPIPGSKLAIGLPPMRMEGGSGSVSGQLSTMKSMNMSGMERVSMYRNEEDRQNKMKQISE